MLLKSFEEQGNFLFKYRGQFPVILFLIALPFMYFTDYTFVDRKINSLFLFFAYFISCIGFFIRFYTIGTTPKGTSGRNTKEQIAEELNSTGIYSLIRHPLYLGNYLIWLGISISTFNFYFIIIMSLLFWLYYERIMFAEERFLERKFGEHYVSWSSSISAFFPLSLNYQKSKVSFSFISILRREYSSILSAVIGFIYIEFFRNYFIYGFWFLEDSSLYFFIIIIISVLILRTLKHKTNFLNEKGRS
ncbi:MAG: lipid A phosphate methyltransferase [Flavobacteriales bacterium]|nr:lipid A phosphate methyltransferase [Flavobacteriales bacterium]|tara:strand:+ start:38380 stop:39120 length:741 start_codon:yes stop_codon:yes gene_type:complete